MSLHSGYRLYVSPSTYVLEPTGSAEALRIDRSTRQLSLSPATDGRGDKVLPVQALVGLLPLAKTDYLIVVTAASKVATIIGAEVYRATAFQVLPVVPASAEASLKADKTEQRLVSLLASHLHSGAWYFSYAYDLTNSLQRQTALAAQDPQRSRPAWQVADDRFFWNKHASSKLIQAASVTPALGRFIQPIMYGFLEYQPVKVAGRDFLFILLSRRSRYRAGTRYFSRGLDNEGHVSNFNETEQLVLADSATTNGKRVGQVGPAEFRLSLVQIRGSVPVYWAEVNNMRYKPDLLIKESPETVQSAEKHFQEETDLYGDIYIANLVNQKGYELPVKDAFERAVNAIGNQKVHYTYFDFHHECRNMHYENIDKLLNTLASKGLPTTSYFADVTVPGDTSVSKQIQTAALRTNCMDCLDRTNVVQASYAKAVLTTQLLSLGILTPGQQIENFPQLWSIFRNGMYAPSILLPFLIRERKIANQFPLLVLWVPLCTYHHFGARVQCGRIMLTSFPRPTPVRAPLKRTLRARACAPSKVCCKMESTALRGTSRTTTLTGRGKTRTMSSWERGSLHDCVSCRAVSPGWTSARW